jgi:SAM-dependent methyltransferase
MKEFFEAIAGRYERAYALSGRDSRLRLERVLRALPPPPARVLDLGVGTGRELSALLDAGHSPTGVDVSPAMLERCRRRARVVPLVEGDFWRPLAFADASFDAVIALHGTLAHPPDDRAVGDLAAELARVVRGGGALVAEVPSPAWLNEMSSWPGDAERRIRRTGERTCVYEDLVVGASIEARVLDADGWRRALGRDWDTRVEPLGELELLVLARRAG